MATHKAKPVTISHRVFRENAASVVRPVKHYTNYEIYNNNIF